MHAMGRRVYAAVDLGAGSGRVIVGLVQDGRLTTREVHRFRTSHFDDGIYMRWDVSAAFDETLKGLRLAAEFAEQRHARFAGVGIDSWGVDYGLLSRGRADLDDVRHHRKAGVDARAFARLSMGPAQRYAATGILDQTINTSRQLGVRVAEGSLPDDSMVLFIPDLWIYLLTGTAGTDPTIASTSQLLDLHTANWSEQLLAELHPGVVTMPPISMAGSYAGATTAQVTHRLGVGAPLPVFRVAGHDTASALAFASPARRGSRTSGLISSGTWSLAGLSLERPIASERARLAGYTTERALRGFLMVRNLSGMWLLQECLRTWSLEGGDAALTSALTEAAAAASHPEVVDVADDRLLNPGNMPRVLAELAAESGRPRPSTRGEIVRVILDSLADAYANGVADAAELAGVTVDQIRVVGGGAKNRVLCQATADRSGLPVIAGPAEATALGNIATQIWASGFSETVDHAYMMVASEAWGTEIFQPQWTDVGT